MEKINLVYIGPKPFKKDTVTGSRLLFPRGKPVATPSDVAWRLLAHPLVWMREEAIREAEEQARRDELERQKRDMNCGEYGDIGRLTAAQLRTLVEGAELDVQPQGAQEKVDVYRLRVRDALRAKIAAEGEA